jgi:SnoaL-like domain
VLKQLQESIKVSQAGPSHEFPEWADCNIGANCAKVLFPAGRYPMLDQTFAKHFATEWIAAWNSHNLQRVLSHYTDDFEMSSPLIAKIAGEPSCRLKGKRAVGAYWARALELNPDLHFELLTTLVGAGSVTICYQGQRGMAAEVLVFGPDNKVTHGLAHYAL